MSANVENDNEAQNQDKLTLAQLTAIENEIKTSQPLTSQLLPISALLHQYSNGDEAQQSSAGFIQSAQFLCNKYSSMRRVRGDGNCYYRAFLYSLCEQLLNNYTTNSQEFNRIKEITVNSLKWVCQFGYEEMAIDMFHEELVELFDFLEKSLSATDESKVDIDALKQQLHNKLNEENSTSDYCTWFFRLLSAAQMKSNPDRFLPFLLADELHGNMDIATFCSREVEPMGRECGMVTVAALAECMGVKVVIEYVDGRVSNGGGSGEEVVNHVFGEVEGDGGKDQMCLTLLYRPGHYDILY